MNLNFKEITQSYNERLASARNRIVICGGTGCVANGSLKLRREFEKYINENNLNVVLELSECLENETVYLSKSGCQGFCQMGPLVSIWPEGVLYTKVQNEDIPEIVEKTLVNGEIIDRLLYKDPTNGNLCHGQDDIPFYKRQTRTVLETCGSIDPEDLDEYIANGGYEAAHKALYDMTPKAICEDIINAGLRGRGGGGFPTGRKWELTRVQNGPKKYVICNADEGDPGAFMDRSVMEGNPHAVIEGMMIAARAIGADEGYIYVRLEYPLAVKRVRRAVKDAEERGILGDNILGTDHSFRINVMEGAGAFVCGEETALMASIEGKRGMPNPKPPFPAESGLWGCPTVINNVETLASVPLILRGGVQAYRAVGTETSPGTKTFALTGHVANTGLIEVPFGTTLREIVYNIGGGVLNGKNEITHEPFKAVQIGGPSGGCLTEDMLDLPLDFDSLQSVGAMVGSGGLVVMNQETCMVQIAKYFMQFTQNESCGKCVLCREGTKQMLTILNDITEGEADDTTLETLDALARAVKKGSLCGLGKTAPNPVLSVLSQFRAEIEAHVVQQRCPAGECKSLATPEILADKCRGCTICARKCPVDAITGEKKQPHVIDVEKCIKCGTCAKACKFDAIVGVGA